MECDGDSSSSEKEWAGESMMVDSRVKFLAGAKAHDKNEAEQRY